MDETRNYVLNEIKHNDLISEKNKKTCKYLNYVEHLLILISTITSCVSISAFASLVCVPVGITKYTWVKPLKNKKGKTVLNAFIKTVSESNRKPNKLWIDQGR